MIYLDNGATSLHKPQAVHRAVANALQRCAKHRLAAKTQNGSWHLTPEGFLVSNTIISDLLLIQDGCEQLQGFTL